MKLQVFLSSGVVEVFDSDTTEFFVKSSDIKRLADAIFKKIEVGDDIVFMDSVEAIKQVSAK